MGPQDRHFQKTGLILEYGTGIRIPPESGARTMLSIGQVARRAGVGVETIRFYEREGLLAEPGRRLSGHRLYDEGTVTRLMFIRRAKELGFTLREIKELLSLRHYSGTLCGEVRARAEAKIKDIDSKIKLLRRMKDALGRLTAACGKTEGAECPILDALDGHEID
jgi:MerR family mercuric resistance operon transcriptional regulator